MNGFEVKTLTQFLKPPFQHLGLMSCRASPSSNFDPLLYFPLVVKVNLLTIFKGHKLPYLAVK